MRTKPRGLQDAIPAPAEVREKNKDPFTCRILRSSRDLEIEKIKRQLYNLIDRVEQLKSK